MIAPDCIFCRILERTVPARVAHEDDQAVAFHDVNPQAPVHLLLIPRTHITTLSALNETQAPLMGHLVLLADRLARAQGVAKNGYRLVINCGAQAGQSVDHLHLHLLGGRAMRWPPG